MNAKLYWRSIDLKHYSIQDALEFVKNASFDDIAIRLESAGVVLTKEDINKEHPMALSANQFLSHDWEVVVPDHERSERVNEVRDFMMNEVPGFELDSRFYDEEKMDIHDWFNRLNEWLNDDNVRYNIFMYLKEHQFLKNAKHF